MIQKMSASTTRVRTAKTFLIALALIALVVTMLPQHAVASEDREVINASEILATITRGEPVKIENADIRGNLDMSEIWKDLPKDNSSGIKRGIIERPINIDDSTVQGEVNFSAIYFNNSSIFSNVTFEGEVYFRNTFFEKEPDFRESTFKDQVDFSHAIFNEETYFSEVTFDKKVWFLYVVFNNRTHFYGSVFTGLANFAYTTFNKEASFPSVIFNNIIEFNNANFNGGASFYNASFNQRTEF